MSRPGQLCKPIYLVVAVALVVSLSLVATIPVLAAPVVTSITETSFDADTTNHDVNMPATVDVGDLLIVLFTNDGNAAVTTPAGWSLLASSISGAAVRLSVYYKIAAGTEGSTTVNFVTSATEQAAAQVYRIKYHDSATPPEISSAVTGLSIAPDPASLDPVGWDVADTLWIAVAGQDRGDQVGTTDYPANYTNGISTQSRTVIPVAGICRLHSARRILATASEDPGVFTIPVLEDWVAYTIAIKPVQYDLTVSTTEGGSVTTPGPGLFTYDAGVVVDLVAVADEDYQFVEWTGDVDTITDINAPETTITMYGDYLITAVFEYAAPCGYYLAISSTNGGSVTEPGEEVFTYEEGTVISLVAAPDFGYRFDRWIGDVDAIDNIESVATIITINDNYSITAKFVEVGITPVVRESCFVTAATYGTPMSGKIQILREFRNEYLLTNPIGISLVKLYYMVSPSIAEFIIEHPSLKPIVRAALLPILTIASVAV